MKKDFVSLAEARPDLAKEWNYEKNVDLKPEDVSCGCKKKIWWKLPYDVPDDYPVEHLRGKHFEFEWEARINDRTSHNSECPFLTGNDVYSGFNDLATVNPVLAKEWHPTKNGDLKPTQVTAGSTISVWWLLNYNVPMDYPIESLRGKEFNVDSIARRMMDWLYKGKYTANGKVFDVGNTTREAIWRMHKGVSPIEAGGKDEYSNGNGSLMRIHPLAFYLLDVDNFEEKKNMIYQVSSLTHANIISKVACHFLVELIIRLLKTNSIRTAYDAVCREFAEYYTEDKIQSAFANIFSGKILSMPASSVKSSGYVIDTLEAVLWCIFHTTTYKDAVLTAVNLGDDTDTVGAITGGIAGIIYGLNAIPEEWISKLVNKMIVLNAASDLYKKCNKDNIIDNLDFSV